MNKKIQIENLSNEMAVELAFNDDKESIEFEIKDKNKVDIDKSITRLRGINTKEADIWAAKLEIVKQIGWEEFLKGPLAWINKVGNNINIVKRGTRICLLYKGLVDLLEFKELPEAAKHIIKVAKNFDKDEMLEIIKNDKAISMWLSDPKEHNLIYFFDPIKKIKPNEKFIFINMSTYEKLEDSFLFEGDGLKEYIEKTIEDKLIPRINVEKIKIKIKIGGFNSYLQPLCKFKNLVARKSFKAFLSLLKKYDIPKAVAETDLNFDDIEFDFWSFYVSKNLEESIAKEGQRYLIYYLKDLEKQLKNNQFYGMEFKNGTIKINSTKHIEELDNWKEGLRFLE